MGQEFSIVFDVVILVIIGCFAFAGWKKGFAKVILSMAALALAFGCAMALSDPIANAIYRNHIRRPLEEQLDNAIDASLSSMNLGNICDIDFSKVEISGVPIDQIDPKYAGTGKAVFDLSDVDLSGTGISGDDLKPFGADADIDLTSVNAKTAEFSMDDIEKYGLGKLAVSQFVAVNLMQKDDFKNIGNIVDEVGKYIPGMSGGSSDSIGVSAARTLALTMIETRNDLKASIVDGVIAPNCIIVIRTVAFIAIFALVSIVVGIIANLTGWINKIPVIGKANAFVGAVAGLCEGLVVVFIVCMITRFIVSLCGGNAILFNQTTIDSTFLFKRIYEADFINFLI